MDPLAGFFSEAFPPRVTAQLGHLYAPTQRWGAEATVAFREVTMIDVKEVLRQWLSGVGKKRVGANVGLDPTTVRHQRKVREAQHYLRPAELRMLLVLR